MTIELRSPMAAFALEHPVYDPTTQILPGHHKRSLFLPGFHQHVGNYPGRYKIDLYDINLAADLTGLVLTTDWHDGRSFKAFIPEHLLSFRDDRGAIVAYKRALSTVLPEAIFDDEVVVEYDTPEM